MSNHSDHELHIFFFPLMAKGHLLPTLDMARLFAARGVKTSIITTTLNAPLLAKPLERTPNLLGSKIQILTIEFPASEAGLPHGLENLDLVKSQDQHRKFFLALQLLEQPLENLIQQFRPQGLVADLFFPWATDLANKYKIPRLVFHGTSFVSMCAMECVRKHKPHKDVTSDTELFVLPGLPDDLYFSKQQLPEQGRLDVKNDFIQLLDDAHAAEKRSFGMIVNSFYELEPSYVDHFRQVMGRRAWHVGPVSLCNKDTEDKALRGKSAAAADPDCLKWLEAKKPSSVIYVCFGTVTNFSDSQLCELALGLEASGQDFIWVVRKDKRGDEEEKWLPQGFEERVKGRGLIIRGWAPQMLILDHEATGGFLTHCGWNSALEGITAGLPMVTWPIFAEQFYNEKLITQILKTGVGVGAKKWIRMVGDFVKKEAVEKAVKEVMVGERAEEMRSRAKALGMIAKKAVEEGGSSYNDLSSLIQDLRGFSAVLNHVGCMKRPLVLEICNFPNQSE